MESLKPRPGAPTPLDTLIRHATWIVREHGILRDMLESDPGFVLQALRQNVCGHAGFDCNLFHATTIEASA